MSLTAIGEGLVGRGHRVTIVCRPDSALHRRAPSLHSAIIPLRIAGDIDPVTIWRIHRLITHNKVDVVCVHTNKELRVGGIAASLAHVPTVISREIDLPIKNTRLNRFFYTKVASAVMVNSFATMNTLLASAPWLHRDRITVVWKGIDIDAFTRAQPLNLKKEFRLGEDAVIAGFVGRLEEQKGIATLLEAMSLVVQRNDKVVLVMAGEGSLRDTIATFCSDRRLGEHIVLAGFREDIPAFMKAVDFLVMPSNWEGFGYSAAEAMAAGKPVIATNVSSLPEIVQDGTTGILVPPRTSAKLAEAILALADDVTLRESLGRAGARRAEETFPLSAMLDKVESLFRKIAQPVS
ncbi:MAG: hypothetical protein A3G76_08505 [Acidobacteria bacterium RIFCSPLOWO2_12_FULL_65_11]|nr:MAG: hypothetical protein A3H95_04955 [Acidobacteria bacterium RIFCSPLOWO2_02_FULL_64_15]OFW30800.1 MAG: hypothetical protein A3G76_08505 [Acidobacteria bacterium RIFCSPLOWO2_12_FULL_65_11]